MNERFANRIAAIMMISVLLLLYLSPVASYAAGTFMTPGQPMTPGQFYTPGQPITGGTFMIPGNVYKPGKTYNPGEVKGNGQLPSASGQPIFPGTPYNNGSFLIPNAPTPPVPNLFLPFKPSNSGNPIQGGTGEQISNGKIPTGGNAKYDGKGPTGGNAKYDGKGPTGGNAKYDGKGPTGGNANIAGTLRDGSTLDNNGFGPRNEKIVAAPATIVMGDNDGDDESKIPKEKFGEEVPWKLNPIFIQTLDPGRGGHGHGVGFLIDANNVLSILNKDVLGPTLAYFAGFKIEKMPGGKSGYKVSAKKFEYKNKLLNNIYQEYKSYYDGKVKSLGVQTSRIKEKTLEIFRESKNLKPKDMGLSKYVKNAALSSLKKLGGPANVVLSTANSLFDFSEKGRYRDYGYKSTEFAADLSVELAIGVGTTAVSSVISSVVAGAAAGSVVPGLGTAAGAVAGLIFGLGANYFINGTRRGIEITNAVKKGVNKAYEGVKNGLKKLGGAFGF
ncbi:hypothetical protein ACNQFZ_09755 [Schinkia sp. CFF1]